ncbi:MAG TPA: type VI secretion system baseplate subunit TssG [Syntrophobacteraceae bacterium]|nr:type VI secretion system baseplate subunit TssG [Syntrophobacteraceae bacterium]
MASQERQSDTPLKDRLLAEYFEYTFYKAVHLLEAMAPQKKPLGQSASPENEPVRFSVKPGLTFPPSDIVNLRDGDDDGPLRMDVAFLGLIGPSGILPHWYNELALDRHRKRDYTLTAFFDVFHHRLISLFYLAWKRHRFPENYLPGGQDKLSKHLLSLIGLGTSGLLQGLGLPGESLIYCSGLLSRPVPSVAAIKAVVSYFADTQVWVDQFLERLLPIDLEDRSQLGMANGNLGVNAVVGSHAWECQSKFRVNIGPMTYSRFLRFMPSGDSLQPVFALIKYSTGPEYEFDVGVYLKRAEVPPCTIGMESPASPRLGWSTWVKSPDVTMDEDPCAVFHLRTV